MVFKQFEENYISIDKIKTIINDKIIELEDDKKTFYTGDVQEKQDLLKDILKELLGEVKDE